jgi:hypothetical protein
MNKYLFFIGKGKGSLLGIPARDLSYDEVLKYGLPMLLNSGLYEKNPNFQEPIEIISYYVPSYERKSRRSKKESDL